MGSSNWSCTANPCNEIGSRSLAELESFSEALESLKHPAHALIVYSDLKCGFCAGADLRELYEGFAIMGAKEAAGGVRDFLERIHRCNEYIDAAPLTTIAAVHGVTFGGGFELALACDLIIADKTGAILPFPNSAWDLFPDSAGIPALSAISAMPWFVICCSPGVVSTPPRRSRSGW